MNGWLLSAEPVRGKPEVKLWIRTDTDIRCLRRRFRPVWYARSRDGDYSDIKRKLREMQDCEFGMVERKLFAGGEQKKKLMKVTMATCSSSIPRVASLEAFLGIERYDFYNVDIHPSRLFMVENRLFPFAKIEVQGKSIEVKDNPFSLHYPLPPLRIGLLRTYARTKEVFPSMSDPIDHVVMEEQWMDWMAGTRKGIGGTGPRARMGANGETSGTIGERGGERDRKKGIEKRNNDRTGEGNRREGKKKRVLTDGGTGMEGNGKQGCGKPGTGGRNGKQGCGDGEGDVRWREKEVECRDGSSDVRWVEKGRVEKGGKERGVGGGDAGVPEKRELPPWPKRGEKSRTWKQDKAVWEREKIVEGSEKRILSQLQWECRNLDLILTRGGDSFDLPYLYHRAMVNEVDFNLGREGHRISGRKGSFFSYGRVLYRPDFWLLRGRFHLDLNNAFLHAEGGLEGCIELSRMSCVPFQTLARVSPGTVINAMEVHWALRNKYPVPFRKNIPESPKTLRELIKADRGGHIFDPVVGLHQEVVELDFFSMYPMIMVRYNISPETLNCECCSGSGIDIPGLPFHFCRKKTGMIPRVIWPILERRMELKKLIQEKGDAYHKRSNALKWLLVTSFGYTGYRNARFGQIECHESINAVDRELIVRASEMAQEHGFRVLHGIVDSLWLKASKRVTKSELLTRTEKLRVRVEKEFDIPLKLEGIFHWIVFLPNRTTGMGALNRYYGKYENGEIKVRGIELRQHDTPDFFRKVQSGMLEVLREATNRREFLELIPCSIDALAGFARTLQRGDVDPAELVFHKRISRELGEYSVFNDQVAALMQLEQYGVEKKAGQGVDYVILNRSTKKPGDRVKVKELMTGEEEYDREVYHRYLLRCGESLLLPMGYDQERLDREIRVRGRWSF